jgi:hypothetical protein
MLPVSITNRIDANSYSTDATLPINNGSGPVSAGVSGLVTNQSISFSGFNFIFPAGGQVTYGALGPARGREPIGPGANRAHPRVPRRLAGPG